MSRCVHPARGARAPGICYADSPHAGAAQSGTARVRVKIVARGTRMASIRYTKDHEWVRLDGETATVGISNYAQTQLGDVVYVELPAIGKRIGKGEEAAVVESVKAASEVYAPVSGEVIAVNTELEATPGAVNEDAEGTGWFLKLKVADAAELEQLMTEEQYKDYLESIA
jgi:glycine cleavage system H protein